MTIVKTVGDKSLNGAKDASWSCSISDVNVNGASFVATAMMTVQWFANLFERLLAAVRILCRKTFRFSLLTHELNAF